MSSVTTSRPAVPNRVAARARRCADDRFVGGDAAGVSDLNAGGDPPRDEAVLGRAVEDHHDGDTRRDDGPQPADQGSSRHGDRACAERAWSTLVPSTTSRSMPSRTRRSSGTHRRPRPRPPRPARQAPAARPSAPRACAPDWRREHAAADASARRAAAAPVASSPCCFSSTSMVSSTAAPNPCPASPPCWPPERPTATKSST